MNAPSSRKIRVGIVGIGNWGRYGHIPVLRLLPYYEIAAVASRRKEYGGQVGEGVWHSRCVHGSGRPDWLSQSRPGGRSASAATARCACPRRPEPCFTCSNVSVV